jgi:hypothetical protein
MRNLTGPIFDDTCRRVRVWAAECDTSTLRVSPPFHRKNTPQKPSFVSAFPSVTQTPPITYRPPTPQIPKQ